MSIGLEIHQGGKNLFRGLQFLVKHPSLWPWALFPFAIQILIFLTITGVVLGQFDAIYDQVASFFPSSTTVTQEGTWGLILRAALWVMELCLRALLGILSFALLLLLTFVIGLIVAGPFNDLLSEKTEALATGRMEPPFQFRRFWKSLLRSFVVELQKALVFLGIPLLFFPFHFIPLVGNAIALVATGVFEMWATGFAFVDYPQGRRLSTFGERWAFGRRHVVALLTFGSVFWIPGILIFCTPPLIVGGTLLYTELESSAV